MQFIKLYPIVLVLLMAFDAIWLGLIVRSWYARELGFIFSGKFSVVPALAFYLLYAAGIVFFVILPGQGNALWRVFLTGAFLGLCAYGAYDLTNQATISQWPVAITFADMAWGAFATGAASALAVLIPHLF